MIKNRIKAVFSVSLMFSGAKVKDMTIPIEIEVISDISHLLLAGGDGKSEI